MIVVDVYELGVCCFFSVIWVLQVLQEAKCSWEMDDTDLQAAVNYVGKMESKPCFFLALLYCITGNSVNCRDGTSYPSSIIGSISISSQFTFAYAYYFHDNFAHLLYTPK